MRNQVYFDGFYIELQFSNFTFLLLENFDFTQGQPQSQSGTNNLSNSMIFFTHPLLELTHWDLDYPAIRPCPILHNLNHLIVAKHFSLKNPWISTIWQNPHDLGLLKPSGTCSCCPHTTLLKVKIGIFISYLSVTFNLYATWG